MDNSMDTMDTMDTRFFASEAISSPNLNLPYNNQYAHNLGETDSSIQTSIHYVAVYVYAPAVSESIRHHPHRPSLPPSNSLTSYSCGYLSTIFLSSSRCATRSGVGCS